MPSFRLSMSGILGDVRFCRRGTPDQIIGVSPGPTTILRTEDVNMVYTDLHSGNLMLCVGESEEFEAAFSLFEESELRTPTPRKQARDGRTIYESRMVLRSKGPMYLTDFGEAQIGSVHQGLAMHTPYQAPEVILGMEWDNCIDMWSVALIVS